ncbi:hypothetical protein BDN71DRAFT_1449729 [Pleurotus eryngii]|uniref:Uncharacterized protein n=1 Tax=Pleurotus eryngii TaxID=5323 RepID=A0A9P6DEB6_PLEER|nr:hypothetical protein BDN71DRAFT_1449729 [Pleurotus eryngii]
MASSTLISILHYAGHTLSLDLYARTIVEVYHINAPYDDLHQSQARIFVLKDLCMFMHLPRTPRRATAPFCATDSLSSRTAVVSWCSK